MMLAPVIETKFQMPACVKTALKRSVCVISQFMK
jgi:hypothetical protein